MDTLYFCRNLLYFNLFKKNNLNDFKVFKFIIELIILILVHKIKLHFHQLLFS